MAHLESCRTRKELTGNIWTYDPACTDESHNRFYTEENQ
jgi:hypothetical protein